MTSISRLAVATRSMWLFMYVTGSTAWAASPGEPDSTLSGPRSTMLRELFHWIARGIEVVGVAVIVLGMSLRQPSGYAASCTNAAPAWNRTKGIAPISGAAYVWASSFWSRPISLAWSPWNLRSAPSVF